MLWKTRDTYEGPKRLEPSTYRRGADGRVMTPADLGGDMAQPTPRILDLRRKQPPLEVDIVNKITAVILAAVIALGTTFTVIFAFHGLWLLSEAIYRAVGLR